MTNEQIDNFNKKYFPYQLILKGNNIHLRRRLLDKLVEPKDLTKDYINLWNTPVETIFIMQNTLLNSLFIEKNNILFINTKHD